MLTESTEQPLPLRRLLPIHIGLLALFVANALRAALANSGVCDELGAHIPSGYLYWTAGQWSGGLSNFPLGQLLIAAPVHWLGHSYQLYTEEHLLLFRLPVILMGTLLGCLIAHLASKLYGPRGGIAALFLYALSPNMLAHSSLATLDLPTAFFVFLTLYCLYLLIDRPSAPRVWGLALALGAALVTKVQAIALLGLIPIILVVCWRRMPLPQARTAWIVSLALAPLAVVALIDGVYLHTPSLQEWLPPLFTDALESKLLHASRGHFGYLMGEYATTGWWYYFPIAIGLKTPLPTLILVAVGLWRRPSLASSAFVLAPLLVFLALGLFANVDIGLRHVLVVYPFLFLLAARGALVLWAGSSKALGVLGVLAAGYVAQAIFISPHHLSYFNVLVGGPTRGHHYLIDSNYDWGQNDHFLRRYVDASDKVYRINPDPFRPSTGRILVNTNALYGVLNGGPAAYRWLKGLAPVKQIAYTWFEFEIPHGAFENDPAFAARTRHDLVNHLFALRERYAEVSDLPYRLLLARAFSSFGAHDVAFDGIRDALAEDPSSELALATGGELIVRYKLGVLPFEHDQYLTGVRSNPPPQPLSLEDEALAQRARALGASSDLSRLYSVLGAALVREGQRGPAREVFVRSLGLDASNQFARKSLKLLP